MTLLYLNRSIVLRMKSIGFRILFDRIQNLGAPSKYLGGTSNVRVRARGGEGESGVGAGNIRTGRELIFSSLV